MAISTILTVLVGWTLHRNGRIFLLTAFRQDEAVADSVNHLLLVGFYLVNIGSVALFLRFGEPAQTTDPANAVIWLSSKIGLVMIALGVMHYLNMFNFAKMRGKARAADRAEAERRERAQILNQAQKPATPAI